VGQIKQKGGGFIQFKEKKYTYKDANSELADYVGFNREGAWFPTDHWEIVIFINFGVMGSGKSVFSNGIGRMTKNLYADTKGGFECYNTNDIGFTLDYLNREENIEKRKKAILLNFDDAMGDKARGMNSLKTMSKENKDFEELLTMIRHKLANENEKGEYDPRVRNGVCVLIFNIQSLKRLSTLVRDNATIKIYKTAYTALKKDISNEEDFEFLSEISAESAKHVYKARSFALMVTGDKSMPIYFPYIKNDGFKIPWLVDDGKKNSAILNALFDAILSIYDDKMNHKVLMSYIKHWTKVRKISIDSNLIEDVISDVIYSFHWESENEKENNKKNTTVDLETIIKLKEKGVKPYTLAELYEKSRSQLYKDIDTYERKHKTTQTA